VTSACRRPLLPLLIALGVLAPFCPAALGDGLPEPLGLAHALDFADADHPDLLAVKARLAADRAERDVAEALTGIRATFAADAVADEWLVTLARQRRRLDILHRYVDVLLADLRFAHANEAMAIAFVRWDRAKQRNALGQISDIVASERRSRYQELRRKRLEAGAQQRVTRSRLAVAMNRPGELSSALVFPRLPNNRRERPALDVVESRALSRHARVRALNARIRAAGERIGAARDALESLAATDPGSTSVAYDRRRALAAAELARREAELAMLRSRLARCRQRVHQSVLEAWLELESLAAAREEAEAFTEYRDLYLDLNRTLYEQEVQSDLGDAMVQISEARIRNAQSELAMAAAWARLDLLTGVEPEDMTRRLLNADGGGAP